MCDTTPWYLYLKAEVDFETTGKSISHDNKMLETWANTLYILPVFGGKHPSKSNIAVTLARRLTTGAGWV